MQRKLRGSVATAAGLLAVLAVPTAAQAHHVDTANSSASCILVDNVPTAKFDIAFAGFGTDDRPVDGIIKVDGTVAKTYTGLDWAESDEVGGTYKLSYTQTLTPGTHTLSANFTWATKGATNNGSIANRSVTCPEPVTTPPDTTPPDTTPPGTTPGGTTPPGPPATTPPPGTPAAGGTPPATPPAAGGVLPETIASGRARLSAPSGCLKRAVTARVRGRSISAVEFWLDGRMIKRISGPRSSYRVRLNPQRYGFGRHRLVARVTFASNSGTVAKRLPVSFRRCSRNAVAPRFTG